MTDAPERIWLTTTESGKVDDFTQWLDNQFLLSSVTPRTEYVRADLHRSLALDVVAAGGQASDAYEAQLKAEAMAEKLASVLRAFQHHESAKYFGPDAIKNASAVMRGIRRKIKAALAEYEASK